VSKWAHTCILHTLTCFKNGILLRDIKRDGGQIFCFGKGPLLMLCGPPLEDRDAWRKGDGPVSNLERDQEVGPLDKKCI